MSLADVIKLKSKTVAFGVKFRLKKDTNLYWVYATSTDEFAPEWQPILVGASKLSQELRIGDSFVNVSDFSFSVANAPIRTLADVTTHENFVDLLANGYTPYGQLVLVLLLVKDPADGSIYTETIWRGTCTGVEYDDREIAIDAVAEIMQKLTTLYPSATITKVDYANAPQSSIGAVVPTVFGDWQPAKAAPSESDTFNLKAEEAGLRDLSRLVPTICTALPDSPDPRDFTIASHLLKEMDTAYSHDVWLYTHGQYAAVHGDDVSFTNASDNAKASLDANSRLIYPVKVDQLLPSTWTDSGNACDDDLGTMAQALSTGESVLMLSIPTPPDLGVIESAVIRVFGDYYSPAPSIVRVGLWDRDAGTWANGGTEYTDFQDSSSGGVYEHTISNIAYVSDFPSSMAIRIETLNWASDRWATAKEVVLVITYRGTVILRSAERSPGERKYYDVRGTPRYYQKRWRPARTVKLRSDEYPFEDASKVTVFAACQGVQDTVLGTYTGTSYALLENPVSILWYLQAQANVPPIVSGRGKVTDVRADVESDGLKLALVCDERKPLAEWIADICSQCLLGFVLSADGTEAGYVYWRSPVSRNLYPNAIEWSEVLDVKIGYTPIGEVFNAIYVQSNYDPRTGRCGRLCYCDGAGSDNGNGTADYTENSKLQASEDAYGRHEFHLEAKYLREGATVVRNGYADMLYERRVALRITLTMRYYDLRPGHVIEIDDASWTAAGVHYPGTTGGAAGRWSYGGTTRYFWVERVSWSDDGTMEIEATERV